MFITNMHAGLIEALIVPMLKIFLLRTLACSHAVIQHELDKSLDLLMLCFTAVHALNEHTYLTYYMLSCRYHFQFGIVRYLIAMCVV